MVDVSISNKMKKQRASVAASVWLPLLLAAPLGPSAAALLHQQTQVFVGGRDAIHTYRIPSMVVTRNGTILVFCEGRRDRADDGSPTNLVLKRSLGNFGPLSPAHVQDSAAVRRVRKGRIVWQPMQVLIASKAGEAYMNPVPIIDQNDGTIFLLVNPYPQPYKDAPAHILLMKSSDEGATWSSPTEISQGTGLKELGPGIGIQMQGGRLVAPTYDGVIFSDDHGKTWKSGRKLPGLYGETQVTELVDGSLMIIVREGVHRTVAISKDGGLTWGKPWDNVALTGPKEYQGCQASLIRYSRKKDGTSMDRLLFSGPADPDHRLNMTVKLSYDEGKTWPVSKLIKKGPGGYSSLTVFPDGTIGLVYETGIGFGNLSFARFDLGWLTGSRDGLTSR